MQLFTNNAASTLASGITAIATSLTVAAGDGNKFPAISGSNFFLATIFQRSGGVEINHEIVKVTARSADVFTIVRAQESTTAIAFNAGDAIELRLTAATAQSFGSGPFVPETSAVPINGMYNPAANTIGWATNSVLRLSLDTSNLVFATGVGILFPDTVSILTNTMTDATTKSARLSVKHYTNAEEPTGLINGVNTAAANLLAIGGGNAAQNAVTQIDFYTAVNTITPTGTSRLTITSAGNVGIGGTPETRLHLFSGAFRISTTVAGEAFDVDRDGADGFLRFNGLQASPYTGYKWNIRGTEAMRIGDNSSVGIGGAANASALLDVNSTTKGFLPPRMTTAQRDAVTTPAPGLVVYNTTTGKLNVRGASAWEAVTSA